MKHAPLIKSAAPKQRFQLGRHIAVLLGDIQPMGFVEYLYILVVFDADTKQPCYYVASEVNSMAKQFGGGSHFLGLFDGEGHANCGSSDDWADEAKFTAEALRIVREKFQG
ncbi:MAG TPA: hypothetical protein VEC99_10570 [Clostridia bacterium]|nr:hypothetical protein [Clostridia bacterium]